MYKMLRSGCRTVIVIGDNDKIYALKNKIVLTNCESDTFNELTFFIEPGIVVGHIEAAISQICDLSDVQRAALADEYLKTLPGFLYKSPAGFISAHNDQLIRVITIVSSAPS
jgi:hypothetical protein